MIYETQPSSYEGKGFTALADPTRRRIVALLAERDRGVMEIAEHFSISRPAISKHLRVLRRAGLVIETKRGRERIQRFDGSALRSVSAWIRHYEAFWQERLATLKAIVEDDQ